MKEKGMSFFGLPMALIIFLVVAVIVILIWTGFIDKLPHFSKLVSNLFSFV